MLTRRIGRACSLVNRLRSMSGRGEPTFIKSPPRIKVTGVQHAIDCGDPRAQAVSDCFYDLLCTGIATRRRLENDGRVDALEIALCNFADCSPTQTLLGQPAPKPCYGRGSRPPFKRAEAQIGRLVLGQQWQEGDLARVPIRAGIDVAANQDSQTRCPRQHGNRRRSRLPGRYPSAARRALRRCTSLLTSTAHFRLRSNSFATLCPSQPGRRT